jgi:hypothetical protein
MSLQLLVLFSHGVASGYLDLDTADLLETFVPNSQTTLRHVPSESHWFIAEFTRDFYSTLS